MTETKQTPLDALPETQRRSIACGLLTGVVFISAIVVARRISGEASPLPEWAACLLGTMAVGIAVLSASIPGVLRERLDLPSRLLATGLAAIPGVLLALSLLPPGSVAGIGSLLGIYMVAVLAGTLSGDVLPQGVRFSAASVSAVEVGAVATAVEPDSAAPAEPEFVASPFATSSSDFATPDSDLATEVIPHPSVNPETTQWMSRSLTSDGDTAEGGCQVEFEPGRKLAAVHIPFAPAFDAVPDFECEPLDETDLKIKVSARHSYGVRIEATRSEGVAEAQTVPLGWFAFSAAMAEVEKTAA